MYSKRKQTQRHRDHQVSFQRPNRQTLSQTMKDQTDALFNKKFTYVAPQNKGRKLWVLPISTLTASGHEIADRPPDNRDVDSSLDLSPECQPQRSDLNEKVGRCTVCSSVSHSKFLVKPEVSDLCSTAKDEDTNLLTDVSLVNEKGDASLDYFSRLLEKKKSMNYVKDSLSDKNIITWHKHTGLMNLAGSIQSTLLQWIKPELCTQAWCKFYEILSSYPIVPLYGSTFHSVHLCEAPGAFITSLNHFLVNRRYRGHWIWLANTLNPYYESNNLVQTITDDRFLRFSVSNWCFGADDTGDIMRRENFDFLRGTFSELGPIHLVTADGSIECQNNPGEQETVVSALHHCEVTMGLHILAPGGALVVKYFTMYEQSTVSMMFMLVCLFNQVHVFKPATSKSGNSEVYVICLDYQRHLLTNDLTSTLMRCFDSQEQDGNFTVLRKDQIPPSFLDQHMKCVDLFNTAQCDTIKANLCKYQILTETERSELDDVREYCAQRYISEYEVRCIPFHMQVIHQKPAMKKILPRKRKNSASIMENRLYGSFNERVNWGNMDWQDKLKVLQLYDHTEFVTEDVNWIEHPQCESTAEKLSFYCSMCWGRPLMRVVSSRFCSNETLREVQEMLQSAKVCEHRADQYSTMDAELENALQSILVFVQRSMSDVTLQLITTCDRMLNMLMKTNLQNCVTKCFKLPIEDTKSASSSSMNFDPDTPALYFTSLCGEWPPLTDNQHHISPEIITQLCNILKHLKNGEFLCILVPVALTRLITGLLYVLYTAFTKMTIIPQPAGLVLSQFVILSGFHGNTDEPRRYLHEISDSMIKNGNLERCALLQIVPITRLLADDDFVTLLTDANDYLLESFFNMSLLLEQQSYSSATEQEVTNT